MWTACQHRGCQSLPGTLWGPVSSSEPLAWDSCKGLPLEVFWLQTQCQDKAFAEGRYWSPMHRTGRPCFLQFPPFSVPMYYFKPLPQICQLQQHPKGSVQPGQRERVLDETARPLAARAWPLAASKAAGAGERAGPFAGSSERLLPYLQASLLAGVALAGL